MALKEAHRKRTERLAIPARLKPFLPKIHWALHVLDQSVTTEKISWVQIGKDEKRALPFFSDFDENVQTKIDRLRVLYKAPRESRSAIVSTALELYSKRPNLNEPDKGYK